MTRKTKWLYDTGEVQKTAFKLPRILLDRARIRAMMERRTIQALIAESIEHHLAWIERACASGEWERLERQARENGEVFSCWKRRSDYSAVPVYVKKKGGDRR